MPEKAAYHVEVWYGYRDDPYFRVCFERVPWPAMQPIISRFGLTFTGSYVVWRGLLQHREAFVEALQAVIPADQIELDDVSAHEGLI